MARHQNRMQGGCVKHCSGRKAPLGISDQKTEKEKGYSRRRTGRSIPRGGRKEAVLRNERLEQKLNMMVKRRRKFPLYTAAKRALHITPTPPSSGRFDYFPRLLLASRFTVIYSSLPSLLLRPHCIQHYTGYTWERKSGNLTESRTWSAAETRPPYRPNYESLGDNL